MHELRELLKTMRATTSYGYDFISMKTVKNHQHVLEPLLLNMVNTEIASNTFPKTLKPSKILPLKKTRILNKDTKTL